MLDIAHACSIPKLLAPLMKMCNINKSYPCFYVLIFSFFLSAGPCEAPTE